METINTKQLKKNILVEYNDFLNSNGKEPNIAYVKIKWVENGEIEKLTQTIVLDGQRYINNETEYYEGKTEYYVPYIKDVDVLYYCGDIDNLLTLVEPNLDDFEIVDIVGFDYLEDLV